MTHALKTWPEYFKAVISGDKTFEVRKNDRPFIVGDNLLLQEWDPQTKEYTGREHTVRISYIIIGNGDFGIDHRTCVMGIKEIEIY